MKFYRVLSKKEYTHKGELKKRWHRVGEIKVTNNGGKFLKLYLFPEQDFYVLPDQGDESEDILVIE